MSSNSENQRLQALYTFTNFYKCHLKSFEDRLHEFRIGWRNRLLQELIFCLCTPQTSPFKADLASKRIVDLLSNKNLTELEIESVLRTPHHYVRFHKTKAKRILLLLQSLEVVREILSGELNPVEERQLMVGRVKGFGYKEASHALRNLGRQGLAIIDRHIARFLLELQVFSPSEVKDISKNYLNLEAKVKEFCAEQGFNVDIFDLAVFMFKTGFFLK